MSLAHRCSQSSREFTRLLEGRLVGTGCRAQHPRPLSGAAFALRRLRDASLLPVVKGKPEGVAEGGERPLGGIRLGAL